VYRISFYVEYDSFHNYYAIIKCRNDLMIIKFFLKQWDVKCSLKPGYNKEGGRSIYPAFVETFTGLVESIEM
jgi:hypothetical protein